MGVILGGEGNSSPYQQLPFPMLNSAGNRVIGRAVVSAIATAMARLGKNSMTAGEVAETGARG